jgi:hypothetical protein
VRAANRRAAAAPHTGSIHVASIRSTVVLGVVFVLTAMSHAVAGAIDIS